MQLMGETTTMHIRVDPELKREATEAFRRLGLSPSEAVRMFLARVVADQAIPFDVKVPSAKTQAAIHELRENRVPKPPKSATKPKASAKAAVTRRAPERSAKERKGRFNSVTALMADLNADD